MVKDEKAVFARNRILEFAFSGSILRHRNERTDVDFIRVEFKLRRRGVRESLGSIVAFLLKRATSNSIRATMTLEAALALLAFTLKILDANHTFDERSIEKLLFLRERVIVRVRAVSVGASILREVVIDAGVRLVEGDSRWSPGGKR